MNYLKKNLHRIEEQIEKICKDTGGNKDSVQIVAVTKNMSVETIKEAVSCGVKNIGENKVQELIEKYEQLKDLQVKWHFIGHLQTNKVKYLVDKVSLIHSVDSFRLADKISQECIKKETEMDILIQVNISQEESKFGIGSEETLQLVKKIAQLQCIKIKGLMTMAPDTDLPENTRYVFQGLRELAALIQAEKIPNVSMQELSMGMTNDFPIALEEGATLIRIGSGIFNATN